MKAIFLYPAIVPFIAYYAREFDRTTNRGKTIRAQLASYSAVVLCIAYVAEVSIVLGNLALLRLHRL